MKKSARRAVKRSGLLMALVLLLLANGTLAAWPYRARIVEAARHALGLARERICRRAPVPSPEPVVAQPVVDAPVKTAVPPVKVATRPYLPDVELVGEISSESLGVVLSQMGKLMGGDHKKDVVLRISTPGGDGLALLLFIDQMQDMKARQHATVTCLASVMAASAGAILLESPVCDRRVAMPYSVILFHGVASAARGKTGNIEDELKLLKALDFAVASLIAPRMGMTPLAYLAMIDRRDVWMDPVEALTRGILDEIASPY